MSTIKMIDESNIPSQPRFSPGEPLLLTGVCLDQGTQAWLKLFAESSHLIRIRSEIDQYPAEEQDVLSSLLESSPSDVYLVDFDKDPDLAARFTENLHSSAPQPAIFAAASQSEPELIIQAMRSGCSEFLIKPMEQEYLRTSLARVRRRRRENKQQWNAELMVLIGAKGGCGVTTLSTQLGVLLASSFSKKTLLLDCHRCFGDAALYLGLTKSSYSSFDLMENSDRLDAVMLQSMELHHPSGLDLIPAPGEVEPTRHLSPGAVARTFDFLRSGYDYIILDLPPGLDDQNLDLICNSDRVYIVTVAEVSALRNVVRYLDYFTRRDIPQENIRVILNRHHSHDFITDEQIEKAIRRHIFWKIPNQYDLMIKAIGGGDCTTQDARSEIRRNLMRGWAEVICAKPGTEHAKHH